MTTLAELLKTGELFAREILLEKREKELQPLYHLVAPPGSEDALVPCSWSNPTEKELQVVFVKTLSREIGAVAVMFICEAWMVCLKPDKGMPIEAIDDYQGLLPSQHPDRIEVVQILAADSKDVQARVLEIKRNTRGRISALVPMKRAEGLGLYMGRLIDGIIPPAPVH